MAKRLQKNRGYYSSDWWEIQIKKGIKFRQESGKEDCWKRMHDYYTDSFTCDLEPRFNMIYMFARTLIPNLIFQNPGIINTARRPEFNTWAQFFDGVDNWLIDQMGLKEIYEQVALHCFLTNMSAVQVAYDDDNDLGSQFFNAVKKGNIDQSRKEGMPWLDFIPPHRLVLPSGTVSERNCPWFAKIITMPVRRAKTLPFLKNVKATHIPKGILEFEPDAWKAKRDDLGYIVMYEIHDLEEGKWMILNAEGQWMLEPTEDPLLANGTLPVSILSFNPGINSIWGTPDGKYIEPLMAESNEIRRDFRRLRRLSMLNFFYKKDAISADDVVKVLTHGVAAIPVTVGRDTNINDVIVTKTPAPPMGYLDILKHFLNDAQLLTGAGPNQMGTFAPGRRTKYETQVVEGNNMLRVSSRRAMMAASMEKVLTKCNQLILNNWDTPKVFMTLGVEGALHWVRANPADFRQLGTQMLTKVNIESLAPANSQQKKQEMIEVLTILAKFQNGLNILPILNKFLSSFDWLDVRNVLPQAQGEVPIEQFQQQQQALLGNPELGNMIRTNLGGLTNVINAMPQGGSGGGEQTE